MLLVSADNENIAALNSEASVSHDVYGRPAGHHKQFRELVTMACECGLGIPAGNG